MSLDVHPCVHVQRVTAPFIGTTGYAEDRRGPVQGSRASGQTERSSVPKPQHCLRIHTESSSRKNFAANLVRELFSPEERAVSNCRGTKGNKKLDQERMNAIQGTLFRLWTLENQQDAWLTAKKAIDEANRRLNRCKDSKPLQELK